jgi:seryl-tRNA(Sec) selenium transferase
LLAIKSPRQSAAKIEARLRQPKTPAAGQRSPIPVIARIEDDRLILDLRTVFPAEEAALLSAIQSATL